MVSVHGQCVCCVLAVWGSEKTTRPSVPCQIQISAAV